MDVKLINNFIVAFNEVMLQLGFNEVRRGNLAVKGRNICNSGVMVTVGVMGDINGNVYYQLAEDSAKSIASTMMMGMPVEEFDAMAQSAISELANMLTAQTGVIFYNSGININISPPTMLVGKDYTVKLAVDQALVLELFANDCLINLYIAVE